MQNIMTYVAIYCDIDLYTLYMCVCVCVYAYNRFSKLLTQTMKVKHLSITILEIHGVSLAPLSDA